MQFNIEIVTVETEQAKKNARGGDYKATNVVYKKDGKIESRAFADWANKDIYPLLKTFKQGDFLVVTAEKPEGSKFWNWVSIEPSDGSVQGGAASPTSGQDTTKPYIGRGPQTTTGKVLGSNYETPVERALRQKLIVAQSSVGYALKFLELRFPKGLEDSIDVEQVADRFYNYVMSKARDLSDLKSDVPE